MTQKQRDLNDLIKGFYERTKDYVLLPEMHQGCGTWKEFKGSGKPLNNCCFGARVARGLFIPTTILTDDDEEICIWDFSQAELRLPQMFDIANDTLCAMFWACGSTPDPFDCEDWNYPVNEVMDKFIQIENEPDPDDVKSFVELVYDEGIGLNENDGDIKELRNNLLDTMIPNYHKYNEYY